MSMFIQWQKMTEIYWVVLILIFINMIIKNEADSNKVPINQARTTPKPII